MGWYGNHAGGTAQPQHMAETCRDDSCRRLPCVLYKRGYRDGYERGLEAGFRAGFAAGVASATGNG